MKKNVEKKRGYTIFHRDSRVVYSNRVVDRDATKGESKFITPATFTISFKLKIKIKTARYLHFQLEKHKIKL